MDEEMKVKISEQNVWHAQDVMQMCIKHELYTMGSAKEYNNMLAEVSVSEPTVERIYRTAKDIQEHSELQTVENIMFLLRREAVTTFYTIEDSDGIR